ncbi:MAG: hypothetical protein M1840_002209 [Geoglossum simile]|nr:MAG: hypothetical protein M1840_002209 [Geoglossum simile]
MDYIEDSDGQVLPKQWDQIRHNSAGRKRIFRDLARIIISLSRSPMERIGSLTIDNQGFLSLGNRPLTIDLGLLEREGIESIERDSARIRVKVLVRLVSRTRLKGPFFLTLTDLRPENIFIDKSGAIKFIVDMEWACALPVEMQFLPDWLTDRCMDDEDYLPEFSSLYEEFTNYVEEEEKPYLHETISR